MIRIFFSGPKIVFFRFRSPPRHAPGQLLRLLRRHPDPPQSSVAAKNSLRVCRMKKRLYLCNAYEQTIELWCNGNTADFGSVVLGSSPDSSTIQPCRSFRQGFFVGSPQKSHPFRFDTISKTIVNSFVQQPPPHAQVYPAMFSEIFISKKMTKNRQIMPPFHPPSV